MGGYHNETEPILERYASVARRINANQDMDKVWGDLEGVLPAVDVPQAKLQLQMTTNGRLGMTFCALPPGPLVVNTVLAGDWAEKNGVVEGETIVAVNGRNPCEISRDEFMEMMKKRPIVLTLDRPAPVKQKPPAPAAPKAAPAPKETKPDPVDEQPPAAGSPPAASPRQTQEGGSKNKKKRNNKNNKPS